MTLDRIRNDYSNTYFCQVSKWGKDLNEDEAIKLGLIQQRQQQIAIPTKTTTPQVKTPTKRRTRNNKTSKPINNKEVIE